MLELMFLSRLFSFHSMNLNYIKELVDVELIPLEPLHIYCNNNFALQTYIHSQLCIDFKHTYICSSTIRQIHDYF
jgi:hypothetical protein